MTRFAFRLAIKHSIHCLKQLGLDFNSLMNNSSFFFVFIERLHHVKTHLMLSDEENALEKDETFEGEYQHMEEANERQNRKGYLKK